jgi:hypothetical protein
MQREYVESSMILSIGYESATSTLEIEFKNGGSVWQYFDVPESLFYELKSAVSIGKFFLASIKNQYSESRVG